MNVPRLVWWGLLVLGATGCGGLLESDRYTEAGVWERGDGTSYVGPAPIAVGRVTCEAPAREFLDHNGGLRVSFTLLVELQDGSRHEVPLEMEGPVGSFAYDHGTFMTGSGARYAISCGVAVTAGRRVADVTVVAPGPVRYVTQVALL